MNWEVLFFIFFCLGKKISGFYNCLEFESLFFGC